MAVMSLKVPDDMRDRINAVAEEDFRTQQDEIRYLIQLGLNERRRVRDLENSISSGKTQISPALAERYR